MNAWINNRPVTFEEGETILQVAKRLGIFIPTLCALLPLDHTPGTCRMCITEIERKETPGKRELVTSCTTPMLEGMAVFTHTPEVRHRQRQQAAWIFSDHDQDCASCVRHGNCRTWRFTWGCRITAATAASSRSARWIRARTVCCAT